MKTITLRACPNCRQDIDAEADVCYRCTRSVNTPAWMIWTGAAALAAVMLFLFFAIQA